MVSHPRLRVMHHCCKVQASHPPYDLPREFAEHALQFFKDMEAAGIAPNAVHYWTLMDCQVRVNNIWSCDRKPSSRLLPHGHACDCRAEQDCLRRPLQRQMPWSSMGSGQRPGQ